MRLTKRGHLVADAVMIGLGFLGGVYLLHVTRYLPETAFIFLLFAWLGVLFWSRKYVR